MHDGDETASSDQEKANLFAKRLQGLHSLQDNDIFGNEWKETVERHVTDNKKTFQVDMDETYSTYEDGDENPMMTQITTEEVLSQLRKCKNKSSPGSDGLNYLIIKKLSPNVIKYLTILFNAALHIGYFPQSWKHATVKLVPKPGKDNKEAKNWRPISLLSCVGKLFERIIGNRLSSHLEKHKLLSPYQSGFRKGRMTTEQLFRLSEDAHSSFKKKGITAALFLDAEAAFDKAWHDGIRFKIHKLGITNRLVRLISSFLNNRKLTVKVGEKYSDTISMEAGTPQGSCLSPLLYIILVNDIPNLSDTAMIGQFADDIALWVNAQTFSGCRQRLQAAVNTLERWCRRWRIKLNESKSNLLYIHRSREKPTQDVCLQLFNGIIRPKTSAKYLGVEFDEKLKFDTHFKDIARKSTSRLNIFKMLVKNGVDNSTMIRLYKTYVRPLFEYGSISFLPANILQLQRIQNEFICLSLNLPKYIRTDLIHQAAGIDPVENRLLELNHGLMRKMIEAELEGVQQIAENSLRTIPLNNHLTPLDKLLKYQNS